MSFPYREVFENVEKTLLAVRSRRVPKEVQLAELDAFKDYANRQLSDDEYFRIMVKVVFYSGFRAETVKQKEAVIFRHLPDLKTVAAYGDREVEVILNDSNMIRNARKVEACIANARLMAELADRHGSFRAYLLTFGELKQLEDVLLVKETLEASFAFFGGITTYHFMTDAGLPVLKPDRVLTRMFERLGLIENDKQLLKTVLQGQKFAVATGLPIRYIDIVFVLYGQASATAYGIDKGICLEKAPQCSACGIRAHCRYEAGVPAAA